MPPNEVYKLVAGHSILVDKIEGRGRVSGLLHALQKPDVRPTSFATVTARRPTKLWTVTGDDFGDLLSQDPEWMNRGHSSPLERSNFWKQKLEIRHAIHSTKGRKE